MITPTISTVVRLMKGDVRMKKKTKKHKYKYIMNKQVFLPFLMKALLLQSAIILVIIFFVDAAIPVERSELIPANIVISDMRYYSGPGKSGKLLYIQANGQEYVYNGGGISDWSCWKVYKNLSVGDELSILYANNCYGQKVIYETKSNDTTYCSYENYLKTSKLNVPLLVFMIIGLEAPFVFFMFLSCHTKKFFRRKKIKKKKTENSEETLPQANEENQAPERHRTD